MIKEIEWLGYWYDFQWDGDARLPPDIRITFWKPTFGRMAQVVRGGELVLLLGGDFTNKELIDWVRVWQLEN